MRYSDATDWYNKFDQKIKEIGVDNLTTEKMGSMIAAGEKIKEAKNKPDLKSNREYLRDCLSVQLGVLLISRSQKNEDDFISDVINSLKRSKIQYSDSFKKNVARGLKKALEDFNPEGDST